VIYDHVQAMGGSSWLTRNRILVGGEARWFTLPIVRSGTGLPPIDEVRVQWDSRLIVKQLRTLENEYRRHPHFEEVYGLVSGLYEERPPLIADFNQAFLERVLDRLEIEVDLVRSTELAARDPRLLESSGSALVLATCEAAGATAYISGEGSYEYIDPPAFERAGLEFYFQRYVHPEYPQRGAREFVSHLSVLDALFNVGFDGTRELVVPQAAERIGGTA
jgi:hypothetical protein